MMDKQLNRSLYIDLLRVLGVVAVVLIHIDSPLMNMNWGRNQGYWWIGNVVMSLLRFAVPVFVMISGATLLTREIKTSDFYRRRFLRVVLPLLFWLPAYWLFRWFMLSSPARPTEFDEVVNWAFGLFVTEGVSKHLWYMYMIVVLYALMPLMAGLLKKINERGVLVLLGVWLFYLSLQQAGLVSVDFLGAGLRKVYNYLLYIGYLLTGYYLVRYMPCVKIRLSILMLVFVLTVLLSAIVSYWLSMESGRQNTVIMGSLGANSFVQAVAVFLICRKITIKSVFSNRIILWMSELSFGVYFIHIMVIILFYRIGVFWTMAHPVLSVPLVLIMVLMVSFSLIYALKKIPFLNKFIG